MKVTNGLIQVSKVAKILDVKKDVVYELIRDGKLEAVNLGIRRTRIFNDSLAQYIESCRIKDTEAYLSYNDPQETE